MIDNIKYKNAYNVSNYDRFSLFLKKGNKDILKEYAKSKNMSLNGLLTQIINEYAKQNNISLK